MALLDKDRRLRLVDGVDLRALPLTPEDAFVVSQLDGSASEGDIALATGLDVTVIRRSLEKLRGLGALSEASPAPKVTPRPTPSHATSGTFHIGPVIEATVEPTVRHPVAALYDPAELDEAVDLDLLRKRKVLDTFYRLSSVSHYELLGVDAGADKKAIKAAYFELVNAFHPDRYFGKKLGSFKPKLEKLFARVTEAHDVLTRQGAREDYDRYLASVRRTQALDSTLTDASDHAREVARVQREIQEQVRLEEKARHSYPPPAQVSSGPPKSERPVTVPSSPTPPNFPSSRPSDSDARRRALARKLGVSMPPVARTPSQQVPVVGFSAREAATADLKRRYEDRIVELKSRQVQHYVSASEAAESRKDLVSATNALRIATSLVPEDATLANRLRELETRAVAGLADSYLEQAQYEEKEGRFLDAAASYRRASRGKPLPRVLERIAFCLYSGKGDLKEAADFAKRARDGAPENPAFRLTLGQIYLEAGMKQSAAAEFEHAQQLSPKDDTIKDWLKRARRSEP